MYLEMRLGARRVSAGWWVRSHQLALATSCELFRPKNLRDNNSTDEFTRELTTRLHEAGFFDEGFNG